MDEASVLLIWDTVRHIPKGKVSTYGDIARICGLYRQARFVGRALRRLPSNSGVPWHRVINSQGRISFPEGERSKYRRQKELLRSEGVVFDGERVDLERYRWRFDLR